MESKKRILFTITSLFGGGAERVVSIWASQLADLYDVSILIYGRDEKEYLIKDNVKIYTVAPTYKEYKKLSFFQRIIKMRKIIKNVAPDVIINFLPRMQIWIFLASFGIKIFRIETVRNNPWRICTSSRIEHWLWMKCFKKADAIILQTNEQKEYFSEKLQRKCVVIPNPIDRQYFECIKKYTGKKITNFIAAGRLTAQKNYPLMIRAFSAAHKRNPKITLSIYGSEYGSENESKNEYKEYLHSIIRETGMEGIIKLMGRTNQMCQALLNSDAFIMTSDFEGMPNALAEAMAVGLVCISTNCKTGPKDLIDDQINGFLVDVGNEKALTEVICAVSNLESQQIEKIGKAARKRVITLCSNNNSINRLIDLISKGLSHEN